MGHGRFSFGARRREGRRAERAQEGAGLVKRRVVIPLANLGNPLMASTEFLIDARYRGIRHLGAGSFGVVVRATDAVTGDAVAIKKIFNAFLAPRMARHVLREIRLLRHLRHPNIIALRDIDVPLRYDAWDAVYVVTPLLEMDLRTALVTGKLRSLEARKRVIVHVLRALEHMHALCVMHRDVKSLNVLLDADMNASVCDLGESRFYSRAAPFLSPEEYEFDYHGLAEPELTGGAKTKLQSAPELDLSEDYNSAVDMWSFGCVIAEMLHPEHLHLFDIPQKRSQIQAVLDIIGYPTADQMAHITKRSSLWYMQRMKKNSPANSCIARYLPDAEPAAIDLLSRLLRFNPKERLTASEALAHPWLDDVRGESVAEPEHFNFALSEPPDYTSKAELKRLVWEEIVAFHPEAASRVIK